jgi:V/A-type H+-transporting ATPase subunit E
MDNHKLSSGVQELIDRLRDKGIAEGQKQADSIISEAREQAAQIIEKAKKEAGDIMSEAQREAEKYRKNAEEALEIAARDTVLDLKNNLTSRFSRRVSEMVGSTLDNEEFLQKVILEVAGKIRENIDDKEKLEILLPADVIGLEELRRNPEKVKKGSLGKFVLSAAEDMFREGVAIQQGGQKKGIRIVMVDSKLQIDINERIVTEIMLQHLLPRFRALLEGSIQ